MILGKYLGLSNSRTKMLISGLMQDDYEFLLDGSRVIAQKKAGVGTMWFYYDANGKRVAFTESFFINLEVFKCLLH